jgi:hypothetical protein
VARTPNKELQDLIRRGENFQVFTEEVLGVQLNMAQQRLARHMRVDNARQWMFKTLVVVAANQIGKTLIQACVILWCGLYKIGVDPSDKDKWQRAPYLWIHLGPVQQQAYHAYKDASLLIKNEHPAQGDRGRLPKGFVTTVKIENYYDGLEYWNGAQTMFRTAEHKAEAVLGYRAAGISVDEGAFVDHLTSVINEVLMMRLISTGGPLLVFSTPNGMNDFFDLADRIQAEGKSVEDMVWHWEDQILIWAVITDNLGFGLDQEEIDRMERDLSPATKEQQLRGAFLEPLEAFFVPQERILTAFTRDLPNEQNPIAGHQYAIFWDPSISSDPTAVIVLDVTEYEWEGVYFKHFERPMDVAGLTNAIWQLHGRYNGYHTKGQISAPSTAITGWDATSMGGQLVKGLLSGLQPQRPVNFGGNAVKTPALTNLRDLLTSGRLKVPAEWTRLRQEIMNYKLKDEKLKQDAAMALMGAAIIAEGMSMGQASMAFDVSAKVTIQRPMSWG